jgi:hypothetical protein
VGAETTSSHTHTQTQEHITRTSAYQEWSFMHEFCPCVSLLAGE